VDAGHQSINYKGGKSSGITNNGSSTSTIGFSGVEDIGGGVKAVFKLNTDYNITSTKADTGSGDTTAANNTAGTWLNSEKFLGVQTDSGEFVFGTINTLTLVAAGAGTPFGTAVGSGYRTIYTADALVTPGSSPSRYDNSLRYTSPVMSGFSGNYYYVGKNTNATTTTFTTTYGTYDTTGVQAFSLMYNQGPASLNYSQQTEDATSTNATVALKATVKTLAGNVKFGDVTAYAMTQKATDTSGALNRNSTFLGAKYVVGALTVMAQKGSAKLNLSPYTSTTTYQVEGQKSTVTGFGADYALSKRTNLYVRSESISDKAGMASARATIDTSTSTTISRTAIGIKHAF
jgi:predicted porin